MRLGERSRPKHTLKALSLVAISIALLARAAPARGDDLDGDGDDDDSLPAAPSPAFRYTRTQSPNYLRASLEIVGILGIGLAEYSLNDDNLVDWELGYDWRSFRSKLVLDSASLDNNRFDTNWVTHPFAGYWYYKAARGNRIPALASYAMAISASYLWELVGELHEKISYNDVVATPTSGFVLGEHTTSFGALLQRSRPTFATRTLSWLLAPFKNVHDSIDGADPTAQSELTGDVTDHVAARLLTGITSQYRGPLQQDVRLELESRIVELPHYERIGVHRGWFYDGEVSELDLGLSLAEIGMTDLTVGASLLPAGYYAHATHTGRHGLPHGQSFLGGLLFTFDYNRHDYDRDRLRPRDRLALVGSGPSLEQTVYAGNVMFRARCDAFASFAGVGAYAMPDGATYDPRYVSSDVRAQRYYHAYGGTLRPRLELRIGELDAGSDARFDWFGSIRGLDREQNSIIDQTTLADRRVRARMWVGYTPRPGLRLSIAGQRLARAGRLGSEHASRHELTLLAGAGVQF